MPSPRSYPVLWMRGCGVTSPEDRRLAAEIAELRRDLRDLRVEVGDIASDLRELLAADRASVLEVIATRRSLRAPPSPPGSSLAPSRLLARARHAWASWVLGLLGTALLVGLARACDVPLPALPVAPTGQGIGGP
jgi:hypothetical protein